MSSAALGVGLGAPVVAGEVAQQAPSLANNSAAASVAHVASATLPFTGFAFGLYLLIAMSLLVVGFVLQWMSRRPVASES
jgi:hypothetical protein